MAAIKNIAREENAVLRHPGMRGLAMRGHQAGWFPAWAHPEQVEYSPLPVPGWRFVILGPMWIEDRYGIFTVWSEAGLKPTEHRLLDESVHLAAMD